jgi:glucose/arabinose dehydrogenase
VRIGRAALLFAGVAGLAGCVDDGPERFADRRLEEARADRCSEPPASEMSTSPTRQGATASGDAYAVAFDDVSTFVEPVDLVVRPGTDDAVVVLEKAGLVYEVAVDGSGRRLIGDVSARIETANWVFTGAQGIEFSPDGRLVYLHYVDRDDRSIIAEFPIAADGTIDAAHFGGDLAFGHDGMLYIAFGDGDSGTTENGGDPERLANDPFTLHGSLLRIDPGGTAEAAYEVPPDNPFVGGRLGAPEVWAWGLRNPWKFTFDSVTGDLWITDVGFDDVEEVSVVPAVGELSPGRCANFGWSQFEGNAPLHADAQGPGHLVFPVTTDARSQEARCIAAVTSPTSSASSCTATCAAASSGRTTPALAPVAPS